MLVVIFALIKIVLSYKDLFALRQGLISDRAGFSTCSVASLGMNVCEVTQCPGFLGIPWPLGVLCTPGNCTHTCLL